MGKRILSCTSFCIMFMVMLALSVYARPYNYFQAVPSGSHDNKFHQGGTVMYDATSVTRVEASSNTTISEIYRCISVNCNVDAIISGATPIFSTTTATNYQLMRVFASSNTFTIQDNDTLSDSCVELLDGTSITLPANSGGWADFMFYGGKWYQDGSMTTAGSNASKQTYLVCSDSATLTANSPAVIIASKNGIMSLTLPTAVGNAGLTFTIKKSGSAGAVTLVTSGSQTVDGVDDYASVDAQYDFVTIISDGSNWHIISRYIQ